MITNQLISITDLRQNATHILNNIHELEKIVVVHNRPKAALIPIHDYEAFKRLSPYQQVIDDLSFLAENITSLFFSEEPDLYAEH